MTLEYNRESLQAIAFICVIAAIRHALKHDMGIRTPCIPFNVALHYLLIVVRFLIFIFTTCWLIPTILKVTHDSFTKIPSLSQYSEEIKKTPEDCDEKELLNYTVS